MIFKLVKRILKEELHFATTSMANWPKKNGGVSLPSFLGSNWNLNYVKMFNIIIKDTCLPSKINKG